MNDASEDRLQIIVVDSLGPVYANNVLRLLTTDNGLYYSKNGVYTLIGATGAAHASSHQNGGSDEIDVSGLSGLLADPQTVNVRKNSTGSVFQQKQLNLIEGSNITLTVADDGVTGEVDITIDAAGSGQALDGWNAAGVTFTYASADSPTFTFTIAGVDLTTTYTPGTRIKLTQATGGTKYFIVTKVAFSTDTTVTVYGGTDYTLNNEAITSPYYSRDKAPSGFPLNPEKWTLTFSDANYRSQAAPTNDTWYNVGTSLLDIHIGSWRVLYQVSAQWRVDSADTLGVGVVTLSTANNSESDTSMSATWIFEGASANPLNFTQVAFRERHLSLSAKATYYLNIKGQSSPGTLGYLGSLAPTIIRAICAYL
jgi:hypothetical protein